MSKVEVDKVIPQSGTTLTIGDSGDTINLVGTLQTNGSPLPGDISSVVAGTGLSGGGTTGDVTLNVDAAQSGITSLGTITGFRSTGIDDNSNALAMTIDSSENIGIGTASPASIGSNITTVEITGGSTVRTGGLYLSNSDKSIKGYWFGSNTGYSFGTESNSDLKFVTNNTERVRIHSGGVMSAVNGIALGVGTANTSSNVLDDYEEGSWSPAITTDGGGGNSGVTFGDRYGTYTKIGRVVTVHVFVNLDAVSSFGTGNVIISTLPFSSNTDSGYRSAISIGFAKNWDNAPSGGTISSNTNVIYLRKRNGTSALENFTDIVQVGDMNANSEIILTATYETA